MTFFAALIILLQLSIDWDLYFWVETYHVTFFACFALPRLE